MSVVGSWAPVRRHYPNFLSVLAVQAPDGEVQHRREAGPQKVRYEQQRCGPGDLRERRGGRGYGDEENGHLHQRPSWRAAPKEHVRPQHVEEKLRSEQGPGGLLRGVVVLAPLLCQPQRSAHEGVEQRPRRTEDPARGVKEGFWIFGYHSERPSRDSQAPIPPAAWHAATIPASFAIERPSAILYLPKLLLPRLCTLRVWSNTRVHPALLPLRR